MIKDGLKLMMEATEDEMIDFIDTSRTQFYNMTPEEALSHGQSLMLRHKSSLNIYGKGCPIHVRGSLLHNHYIKEKGLEKNTP